MRIRSCFYGQMLGSSSISIRVMRIKMKKSMYFTFFKYVLCGFYSDQTWPIRSLHSAWSISRDKDALSGGAIAALYSSAFLPSFLFSGEFFLRKEKTGKQQCVLHFKTIALAKLCYAASNNCMKNLDFLFFFEIISWKKRINLEYTVFSGDLCKPQLLFAA